MRVAIYRERCEDSTGMGAKGCVCGGGGDKMYLLKLCVNIIAIDIYIAVPHDF